MNGGVRLTGDWDKALRVTDPAFWGEQAADVVFQDAVMPEAEKLTSEIKDMYKTGQAGGPPLREETIRRKGHATKLFNTGKLAGSVRMKKIKEREVEVGFDSPEQSRIAGYHEYGTSSEQARPIFGQLEPELPKRFADASIKALTKMVAEA